MCIQDYALAQNQYVKQKYNTNGDGSSQLDLPASKNRTKIIVSFNQIDPTATAWVRVYSGYVIAPENLIGCAIGCFPSVFSIFDYGNTIQGPLAIIGYEAVTNELVFVTDIWNNIPDNALLSYQQINPKGN